MDVSKFALMVKLGAAFFGIGVILAIIVIVHDRREERREEVYREVRQMIS
jgi:hypothetical protein